MWGSGPQGRPGPVSHLYPFALGTESPGLVVESSPYLNGTPLQEQVTSAAAVSGRAVFFGGDPTWRPQLSSLCGTSFGHVTLKYAHDRRTDRHKASRLLARLL